jgi:murein DD-endopeptidase MepM/ murein hydrolase activator NlpD
MPKAKYYFNTHSLKYEKVVISLWKRLLRALGWLSTALVFSVIIILIAYSYQSEVVLNELEQHDDNIYRVIFEAEPIPESVREAGYGGVNKYLDLEGLENSELVIETSTMVDKLTKQLYIQSKSFDEIFALAKNKNQMLASIPAIQPLSNKDLGRIASGFGYRIHPIYKTSIMHTGQDFTAPVGTEIYATGNGVVEKVEYYGRGYGNNVIIRHGYGYETLYGHMSKINVRQGQKINRGDIIGFVGNTGTSTGPHLHYEVIKNGNKLNPVNFFYNDLTPEEYEKMLIISAQQNQSFD